MLIPIQSCIGSNGTECSFLSLIRGFLYVPEQTYMNLLSPLPYTLTLDSHDPSFSTPQPIDSKSQPS